MPLPSAVVVRVVVALPGEIDPLGVSELVANEVQITLSSQRLREHTNDVECADSVQDHGILRKELRHADVHRCVHQPERQRLISDETLVVTLVVADVSLVASTLYEFCLLYLLFVMV